MVTQRFAAAVFIATSLFVAPAYALDPSVPLSQFRHRVWGAEDGLPINAVRSMAQTRDGYLWLGTDEGAVRYDGVTFVLFDRTNTPALRDPYVRAMVQDPAGKLWMATHDGMVELHNGTFRRHDTSTGMPDDTFRSVASGYDGRTLMSTGRGLVVHEQGRFTIYDTERLGGTASIAAAAEDRHGAFWVLLDDGGVGRIHRGRMTIRTDGVLAQKGSTIYRDRAGDLWIGGHHGTLVRLRNGVATTWAEKDGLPRSEITGITEDADGTLWIGSVSGLSSFRGGKFRTYTKRDGLSDDVVWSVFADRDRNLWVGTWRGGLNQYHDAIFRAVTTREGLAGDSIFATLEDSSGAVWLGGSEGVARIRDGKLKNFGPRDGLSAASVMTMAEGRGGVIWVGTLDGLYRITGDAVREYTTRDGLSTNQVSAIRVDPVTGDLWIATRFGPLHRMIDGKISLFGAAEGLPPVRAERAFMAPDRSLVVCTPDGLQRVTPGAVTTLVPIAGLPRTCMQTAFFDAQGTLWGATWQAGLVHYRNGKVSVIGTAQGLPSDSVFGVIDDKQGSVWVLGNLGAYRVSKREVEEVVRGVRPRVNATAYDASDGMPTRETNHGTPMAWLTRGGKLWIATAGGAAVLDVGSKGRSADAPVPVVEQVVTDTAHAAGTRVFRAGTRRVRFDFTAPSYAAPEKLEFRFRLEGFDSGWVDAGRRRKAEYTNIPPGSYRFRVATRTPSGPWRESASTFDFTLEPFFYQTLAFKLLVALAILGAAYAGYRIRIAAHERVAAELTRVVDERTVQLRTANAELASANEQLRDLSLSDALTGVANRRNFDEYLGREWNRAMRQQQPISLLMIDVDHFKAYNDRYGHQQGDECLQAVGKALRQTVTRAGDLVARYGGEEFAVIVCGGEQEAIACGERLRAAIAALELPHAGNSASSYVTASLGTATVIPERRLTPKELIAAADAALYCSKRDGRNRVSHAPALHAVPAAA